MPLVSPESIETAAPPALHPSTRPIRALLRGLDAPALVQPCEHATVAEVATALRLPRTATFRILETLCNAGYLWRDRALGALTLRVAGSRVLCDEAVERFVPALRQAAGRIARGLPGARAGGSTDAAVASGAHGA